MFNPFQIGGIRGWEWLIIIFMLLLLFGSKKIPELARSIGKALGEFERGRREIERELTQAASPPPSPQQTYPSYVEESKLIKAARELGIDPLGKTDEELRREIVKALGEKAAKD